jgi:hypothetical protein
MAVNVLTVLTRQVSCSGGFFSIKFVQYISNINTRPSHWVSFCCMINQGRKMETMLIFPLENVWCNIKFPFLSALSYSRYHPSKGYYFEFKDQEPKGNGKTHCFLAHLRGAYTITWRPLAHFVTTGAIDPKICIYMYH